MREEDHMNRISSWEDQLPSPEELTPLTQTLITPDLAKAFDININRNPSSNPPLPPPSSEFIDSGRPDEQAPPVKRPRLMWTPELHKLFLDALTHLGMENAVPKKILQHMRVDGLTRQNVSSHLQKYRLFLKRLRGLLSSECGNASLDHLSASMPVPHHFLDQDGGLSFQGEGGENYLPSMPPGNRQMAAVAVETPAHPAAAPAWG
ncbi:putative homeodomain-containing protein [Cinnamomum micranthum f. kanehirae]|uniref:Putative homeodomain-containing protein n=1 Tax=Cinnamomum micranthum f. kanehirae TaxID=337451 RepID=A0A3S3MNX4_9MAGN|nr:putative homeodomain-containing protein [Cinnamomum micranthum f. kanehirae]